MGNISKINVNGSEYNVAQSGAVQDISLAYNNSKFGAISINEKGNVAVESLSKHVNIEAVKGIQMKPTTNIIIDTSRRLAADNGNEAHIEVVYDDKGKEGAIDDTSYGEFKVHARNFDLRCHDHGGIALQPCLCDHPNDATVKHFENKIKFESSRTQDLNTGVDASDFSVQVGHYSNEGGKGLEFGTFNNMHTSLYTKDYRFKKDAYVYAVNRGTPETSSSGKVDYPTQPDDTKDIKVNKTRDKGEGVQEDVSLKATWEEIIWTARQYTDGYIQGGGSTGGVTKDYVDNNFCSSTRADGFLTAVPNPLQYITESDKHNFQISVKDMSTAGEYANLNLEGNANIKMSAEKNVEINAKKATGSDVVINSTNNTIISASKVKLSNIAVDASGEIIESFDMAMVEATNGLSMGETPKVHFPIVKLSTKAKLTNIDPILGISYLNNFDSSVYYDSSEGNVHVPYEFLTLYTAENVVYDPAPEHHVKTEVYLDASASIKCPGDTVYFIKSITDNNVYYMKTTGKSKADAVALLSTKEGYENVILENISYVPDPSYIALAPLSETVLDTVKISDVVELVKHKDALLALLKNK